MNKILANNSLLHGLNSYFKFDGNSNNIRGTNNGTSTSITYSSGKINQAANFNGINSQIIYSDILIPNTNTLSFWIKPMSFSNQQRFFYRTGLYFVILAGSNGLYYDINQTGAQYSNIDLIADQYQHIVFTHNSTNRNIYYNGNLVLSSTGFTLPTATDVVLGSYGGGDYFTGSLDEVGFWNRKLGPLEVKDLYNKDLGSQYSFNESNKILDLNGLNHGLISYWKLDGNSNDIIRGNNGNDTGITYSSGKINQAANFNNTSIIDNIGSLSSFSFIQNTGIFTINFWVKTTNFTDEQGLILNEGNTNNGFFLEKNSNYIFFYMSNGVSAIGTNQQLNYFLDTDWHMVTLIGNGIGTIFYKDSIQFGNINNYTSPFAVGDSTNKLKIGSFFPPYSLTGQMDEVGIWDRALNISEIRQLYNNNVGKQFPFRT
jgi:hypothetical protein